MVELVLPLTVPPGLDVSQLVEEPSAKMKAVIDYVAPLVTKSYLVIPRAPWLNASCPEKRQVRELERKSRRNDRGIFKMVRNREK